MMLHKGSCHCGAVKWQAEAPQQLFVYDCNCSICVKKQNRNFIVPARCFKLLQGESELTTYTFNTHNAQHKFCKICGVESFYIPRSNPDGIGVEPHCIDSGTIKKTTTIKWDGQNWEESYAADDQINEFSK